MRYDLNKVILTPSDQNIIMLLLEEALYDEKNDNIKDDIERIVRNYYDTDSTDGQKVR